MSKSHVKLKTLPLGESVFVCEHCNMTREVEMPLSVTKFSLLAAHFTLAHQRCTPGGTDFDLIASEVGEMVAAGIADGTVSAEDAKEFRDLLDTYRQHEHGGE